MKISGLVNSLNFATDTMYVSNKYNTAPVTKVKSVKPKSYSISRAVNREVSLAAANQMQNYSMSFSNKSVVLQDGTLFVGTIIDMMA